MTYPRTQGARAWQRGFWQRGFWRFCAGLALMLAVLLGGPAFSDVEEDIGVLTRLLQDSLSDAGRDVRIRDFEGALSSRATIAQLSIADDQGVWVILSDVVLDWNRTALLSRRVEVNELSAATIELLRLPVTQSNTNLPRTTARESFSLPQLPVSVQIGAIRADRVLLAAAVTGQAAEVALSGAMMLDGGQGNVRFEGHRIDQQRGSFVFVGAFDNATRVLSLDLTLSEGRDGIAASLLGIPERPALGLSVQGTGPVATFGADIALSTDDMPRVAGRFTLVDETPQSGVLQGGGFALEIEGDLRPLLSSELHPFFGDSSTLRASGRRAETGEIELPELTVTTQSMRLSGRAAFGANGFPQLVDLTASIEDPLGAPVVLPGTSGAARIGRAMLRIDHDASVSRDWSIRADLDTLDLPEIAIGNAVLDARGRLNAQTGGVTDGQFAPLFEGVFEFLAQSIEAQDPALQQALGSEVFGLASLVWPGPSEKIDLSGLVFEGQTLSLTAHGALDGLTFDGFAELSTPDLGAFSGLAGRSLGGSALATLTGSANPLTGALDIVADLVTTDMTLDIAEIDALLGGEARINLSLARDTEGTQLRRFGLSAGALEASMEGALAPGTVDLSARLTTDDLSQIGAGYGGHLALDAMLATEGGGQRLRFDGSAIDLRLPDLPASGFLNGLLDGANRLRGDLLFADAGHAEIALFTLSGPRVDLNASGRWAQSDPDLAVRLQRLDLAALAAGGAGVVSGEVRLTGAGDSPGGRRVSLSFNGTGALRSGVSAIDGLLTQGLRLEAQARLDADGHLSLDTAQLRANGLSLEAQGRQEAGGNTRITVRGRLTDLGRVVPGLGGAVQLDGAVLQGAGDAGYDVELALTGPSALSLTTRGRIEQDFRLALVLAGEVDGAIANPTIEPTNVRGMIRFNGSLQGPPGIDALRLDARVEDGQFVLPASGVAFRGIAGEAHLTGLSAQVRVGGQSATGGQASLEGTIDLAGGRVADLAIRAEDLVVRQPQLFDARVNGNVALTGSLRDGALASGVVAVSQAEIRIPNSPLGRRGVGVQGLVHVAESSASRRTREAAGIASGTRYGRRPVPLRLDLTLQAPGRVFVRGRGLDAEMGGTLRLGGDTHEMVPSGSFGLIRGRLDLLGNRFSLTDGSASMVGSFMPYVTLTATTQSYGVATSITVAGQADSPEISFSSVPALPQDEVLARLVFRRTLESLSPFQAAQLALSLATLTGQADNSILSRTRQAMGLDDLDFTVDDVGNTALRAGRYLSDRVYSDVSVDSTGQGEMTINLDLTPNITLRGRADTGGNSGVGVFFERDY